MSYSIHPLQNPGFELKRLLSEQTEKAISILKNESAFLDDRIHDVRTSLKKSRAVLRLMRYMLDPDIFKSENNFYREVQQELSPLRDSNIKRSSLERLMEVSRHSLQIRLFDRYYASLTSEYHEIRARFISGHLTGKAVLRLEEHYKTIDGLSLGTPSPGSVMRGLKKIYRQGRKSMRAAMDDPNPELMHEWRKKTKYLWYQVKLMKPIWPEIMGGYAKSLHRLSGYLGDEHDLSVLLHDLSGGRFGKDTIMEKAVETAAGMKTGLQEEARVLGAKIYIESPGKFTGRMSSCWQVILGPSGEGTDIPG